MPSFPLLTFRPPSQSVAALVRLITLQPETHLAGSDNRLLNAPFRLELRHYEESRSHWTPSPTVYQGDLKPVSWVWQEVQSLPLALA